MAASQRVASLYAEVSMNVGKAQSAARQMSSTFTSLTNQIKTVRDQAKITGSGIMQAFSVGAGIGVAMKAFEGLVSVISSVGAAIEGGVTSVGDFESQMNVFKLLTNATAGELAKFRDEATKLGKDKLLPAFGQADAAAAMTDLAKAGLGATDAINAARPALLLAAAAETSAATGAETLAGALNMFKVPGTEAATVADLIAGTMKRSGQTLGEVSDAMQIAGATFAQANVPMNTFLASVAELGRAGVKGSEAGSSLQQMLLSLIAPSDQAKGLLTAMGVKAYDAQNRFRGFEAIIADMTPALARLNEAQRNQYLSTIFGSNAVRAASIIFGNGVDAFTAMKNAIGEAGIASELAEAKTSGLSGALANITKVTKNAIFDAIAPWTTNITAAANQITDLIGGLVDFAKPLENTAAGMAGLAAAFGALGAAKVLEGDLGGGLTFALIGILMAVNAIIKAFQDLGLILKPLGDLLAKIFGKDGSGSGGGLGGGLNVAVNARLSDDSRNEIQKEIDSWPQITRQIIFSIPGIGSVLALLDTWPQISRTLALVPSAFSDIKAWVDSWPALAKQLALEIPGVNIIQGILDTWNLVARLLFNVDRDDTQKKVDDWTNLSKWLELDPGRQATQQKIDNWANLDAPLDLNPDRQVTQGKVTAWPLLRVDGSLDLSRAEAQAKVDQWALLDVMGKFRLPEQGEVQRLIDAQFPDLKIRVGIEPSGSPLPKGVEPPNPSAPSAPQPSARPLGAIAGPDSEGRYYYPKTVQTPYGISTSYEWRASGGPVEAGHPYIVGERGPEPFIPTSSGTILPNGALGGQTIIVNVYGDNYSDDFEDRVVAAIQSADRKAP